LRNFLNIREGCVLGVEKMKKFTVYATIIAFMSLMTGGTLYSVTLDEYEHRNGNGSTIMAPGYLNVDKARSESMKESVKPVSTNEKRAKSIDADLDAGMLETQPDRVRPELKKKTAGSGGGTTAADAVAAGKNVIIGAVGGEGDLYKDLDIGSGTDQEYLDANGNIYTEAADGRWLAAELIDGVRHVYAGFSDYEGSDAIQQAINRSVSEDIIIVRGGEYDGFILNSEYGDGITLYGGYRDDGIRDVQGAATTITVNDDSPLNWISGSIRGPSAIAIDTLYQGAEINGFHIQNDTLGGFGIAVANPYSYPGVTLANNLITGSGDQSSGAGIAILGFQGYGAVRLEGNTITGQNSAVQVEGDYGNVDIYNNTMDDCLYGVNAGYNGASSISLYNNDINADYTALIAHGDHNLTVSHNNFYVSEGVTALEIGTDNIFMDYNNIESGHGVGIEFFTYNFDSTPYLYHNDISGVEAAIRTSGYGSIYGEGNYINGSVVDASGFNNVYFQDLSRSGNSVLAGVDVGIYAPITERIFQYGEDVISPLIQTTDLNLANDRDYRETLRSGGMISFNLGGESDKVFTARTNTGKIIQGLLENRDTLMQGPEGEVIDAAVLAEFINEALGKEFIESGLTAGEANQADMAIATMLAEIMKNPTAEQKIALDALASLINEVEKLEEESGSDPELVEASDDFAQMVATILLAQALPDLLKEADVSHVKGIFGALDTEKSKILLEYHASVKTYYENVVAKLAANITTLQIKDLLSKELTERELEKLPTQRIDEIVRRIRNAKDKTITEEQILKVEAKYREEYLVPAKKSLEKNLKTLLQGFTRELFGVLDGAGLVKGAPVSGGKQPINIDLFPK